MYLMATTVTIRRRSLRRLRRARGLTQAGLARLVGVRREYICRIERGRQAPSDALRDALASELGVAPEEITRRIRTETT